jgi:hypothetical protein
MTYLAKIEDLIQHRDSLIAQLSARDAEIAELRKDAERYRWLVLNSDSDHETLSPTPPTLYAPSWNFSEMGWDSGIDKAIDAAIARQGEK